MRYTMLEMTQRILESMDSDEVNSISDTTEALTVAKIIQECYWDIIGEFEPRETEGIFHLDSSGDNTKPTLMYLPSNVSRIDVLKYNIGDDLVNTNFREVHYKSPNDFLNYMNGLDVDATWVDSQVISMNGQDFNIKFRNDQSPFYYTSFDDFQLVFDSYDSSYETTLTSARTYGYGPMIPTFQLQDNFIPKLDARQFQLLLQEAKAQAFVEVKQTANEKAEKKARKNRLLAQKSVDINTDNRTALQKRKGYGRC